jgi:hypothetical protein
MPPRTFVSLLKEREEVSKRAKEEVSKRAKEEVGKKWSSDNKLPTKKWEFHSSPSQESLFVFAQETPELTSTPVNE